MAELYSESSTDGDSDDEDTTPIPKPASVVTPEATRFLRQFTGLQLTTLYSARVVESDEDIYRDILEYVQNGQEHGYGLKLKQVVRVVRNGVVDFEHDSKARKRFRMMLWHGTKKATIGPIVQNGFQLPPQKSQMFGPGIYFADRISKSVNYCDDTSPGSTAYLLLCDVLLGRMYNAKSAHNQFTEAPKGFRQEFGSVMCTGKFVPDRSGNRKYKGSIVPCGPTIANTKFDSYSVQYNEYIVYDTSKIRIKFIVHVECTSNKYVFP